MQLFGLLSCLFLVYGISLAAATFKRWKQNTNFNNPDNWNTGRLPCANDHLVFPKSTPKVFVQLNVTVTEIVFPNDGELVLDNYMSFSFPVETNDDQDCNGEDVKFTRTEPLSWFSAENWCETSGIAGSCLTSPPARLETEQVPCKLDHVVFARDSTYMVDLSSGVDIFMSSLYLKGQEQTTSSIKTYLDSDAGRQQFVRDSSNSPTTMNIQSAQGGSCNDITGCICGNDQGTILQKICDTFSGKCPHLNCSSPVLPMGGCCHICGSVLKIDYRNGGFDFNKLKGMITQTLNNDDIQLIMSKTSDQKIQIVLQNIAGGFGTADAALSLFNLLNDDAENDGRLYGVLNVVLLQSQQGPTAGKVIGRYGGGISGGVWVGIVLAILGFLFLIMIATMCFRRRHTIKDRLPTLSLPFKRFGQDVDEAGFQHSVENISLEEASGRSVQGFENPTYDQPSDANWNVLTLHGEDPAMSDNGVTFVSPESTDFSNPLYKQTSQPSLLDDSANGIGTATMPALTSGNLMEQDSII